MSSGSKISHPQKDQATNRVANRMLLLVAVDYAQMRRPLFMKGEIVFVIREDYPALAECEREVSCVLFTKKASVAGRRHINTPTAKSFSDRSGDVLIKMKT